MQVARPVMDAECSGYSRYSKWAGSPWRNRTEMRFSRVSGRMPISFSVNY